MPAFDLSRKAVEDLWSIAVYTQERWGIVQRNRYIKQIDETFHMLAENPAIGRCCDEILPGYRKFPHGSHVIFYRPGNVCQIEIVRILHKSMDVDAGGISGEEIKS